MKRKREFEYVLMNVNTNMFFQKHAPLTGTHWDTLDLHKAKIFSTRLEAKVYRDAHEMPGYVTASVEYKLSKEPQQKSIFD